MLKKILLVIALVSMIAIVGCKDKETAPPPPPVEQGTQPPMPPASDVQKKAPEAAPQANQPADANAKK